MCSEISGESKAKATRGHSVYDALTAQELGNAEHCWLLALQRQVLSDSNYDQIESRLKLLVDGNRIISCKGPRKRYPVIAP